MDILAILIVLFWILAVNAGRHKRAAKSTGGQQDAPFWARWQKWQAQPSRAQRATPATARQEERNRDLFRAPEKAARTEEAEAGEGEDPCHENMLRPAMPSSVYYRKADARAMDAAEEGEDPCHPVSREKAGADHASAKKVDESAEPDALKEDVLRGIIMSEVLARPASRRTRYGRRRSCAS